MKESKRKRLSKVVLTLLFLSFLVCPMVSADPPVPIGVGGRVMLNGNYTNNLTIDITNLNTSASQNVTTQGGGMGDGFYACAVSAESGHIINISYLFCDTSFFNTTIADVNLTTNWLNLSINFTCNNSDDNTSDNDTDPPDDHAPNSKFTYSPSEPFVNETVTFTDISSDIDDDIVTRTWTINGKSFATRKVNYSFYPADNYTISLVVMDFEGNIDIEQKTVWARLNVTVNDTLNDTTNDTVNNTTNDTTNDTTNETITILIEVKDPDGNPLAETDITVFDEDDKIIVYGTTNETGIAELNVPSGTYKIKAFYGDEDEQKEMTFTADGKVTFLFSNEEIPDVVDENYLSMLINFFTNIYVIIGIIAVVIIVVVIIFIRR